MWFVFLIAHELWVVGCGLRVLPIHNERMRNVKRNDSAQWCAAHAWATLSSVPRWRLFISLRRCLPVTPRLSQAKRIMRLLIPIREHLISAFMSITRWHCHHRINRAFFRLLFAWIQSNRMPVLYLPLLQLYKFVRGSRSRALGGYILLVSTL